LLIGICVPASVSEGGAFDYAFFYQFFNVPSGVFDEFMSSPSKEGYYQSKIGERFPCSRILWMAIWFC